uniref:C2H2-type domain-containing protein n=1 Tax=Globodera pallida TaxID=36090 RepID=A0A183BHU3_GLOPA
MSSTTIFTCHLCKRRTPVTFESIDHLEAHFAQHHFQCLPYVCEQCPQFASGLYPTEAAIIQHMKLVHGTESEYEFKIIVREDTEEKRAKVRAAVEQCVRNCAPVTILSSLTTSTTSNTDSGANEQPPQPQQQQQAQTSQQPRVPNVVVTTEVSQVVEKLSATNCTAGGGEGGANTSPVKNGINRTASGGSKRNASEAGVAGKGSPVWKIPKKNSQKKGSESGGKNKESKDAHHQLSDSAAKGGYNGLNIDGLFEEIELQQQNQRPATDKDTNCNNRKDVGPDMMGDMEQNSNAELCSSNGRDDLVRSPLLVAQSSPVKLQISKGFSPQQQDNDHLQGFLGNQKSSSLGLVLYKAEKEGREHRARQLRNGQSSHFSVVASSQKIDSGELAKPEQTQLDKLARRAEVEREVEQLSEQLANL